MNSTIDNLNFAVIIDDTEFNKQIKKMEDEAKRFNTSMSSLLDLRKQAQQWSQKDVENNRRAWQAKVDEERAQEKINREKIKSEGLQRKINAQIDQATKGYKTQSRILSELKGYALGYLSIHGASQLLTSLVRVTGEFELQKTTLAAMLGDLNSAEQIITRIQGLAVESPFQFKELTTYAKQLSAFSVPAQELYDTTKMLADISAGLGVGMDRIVLAYGQVRSAAFLRGQEVRQFTEAGIPILDELAKQFSELEGRVVSTTEVFDKISSRLVPFEMVAKVFKDMTSEGGKFYNMQEVQAETLKGKISNLKDAYEIMLNEIGKGQSENIKGAVDWARRLMQNYEDTGKALVELVAAYGVYKATLLALTVVTNNFALANSKLYTTIISATKWAINNPYAVLAAGITAAGYAIYKNITALEGYEKVHKSFVDTENKYNDALASEELKLDALYAKLKLAKEGTEEYEKAKKQIYTQYAGYISELKEEGVEVGNLVTLYDSLKIKVQEYTQAKFRSLAQTDLDQTFEQEVSNVRDRYKTLVSQINTLRENAGEETLSAMDKEGLWQYITGDIATMWDMAENPELNRIKAVLRSELLPFGDIADELKGDMAKIKSTYAEDMQAIINLYGETAEELEENNPFKIPLEGGGGNGKSPAQKAIEEQIKSIEKLKDAYEKLLPYLDELQMKSTLKSLFPNVGQAVIDSLDFNAELERLADELEAFDEDAAQRLRDSISKDVAGAIADSFNAVEQYKKMLDSWLGEDFDIGGEGVSFDISKIISNLNTEYSKIDQKRLKALDLLNKAQLGDELALAKVREVYGEEVWQKYLQNGKRVLDELAKKERDAAKKTADEKIRDLASKYVSEKLTSKNINLDDFEDKTIKQIKALIERLKEMREEAKAERDKAFADVAMGKLDEGQYAKWQMLNDVLERIGILIEDTGEEVDKKLLDRLKESVDVISDLGGELANLGGNLNIPELEQLGGVISTTANLIPEIVDAMESKDFFSLVTNIIAALYEGIATMITAVHDRQMALNEATREYADILNEIRRDSYSGMFGTDELGLAAENTKILTESMERYQKALNEINKVKLQRRKYGSSGSEWHKESIVDILEDISKESGWDLFLADGTMNLEALEAYFDTFSKGLTKKQRDLISELIESGNALDDASAQQAEYLKSLYGDVADTIADNMVNAFIESGDAAIDMGELVSNTAKTMVADLIKSLYILPILNEYQAQAEAIQSSTTLTPDEKVEAQLNLLETALGSITEREDDINTTLERFADYLGAGEGTKDLGEGIKGITEDQANLLASYLNAIRADVAYSKVLWQRMDANTQMIADTLRGFSAPTLMDYQKRIEANTYNNMIATQEILAELRSMVVLGNEGSALRVYKDN